MHQRIDRDTDSTETAEWIDSLDAVIEVSGEERARYLVARLVEEARRRRVGNDIPLTSDYVNTIPVHAEPPYPGDEDMEKRLERVLRWNAAIMVARANKDFPGIGGHISTYASCATLLEVGFNHFFRGKNLGSSGDQIYFQGHASPGLYARAFLHGTLTEDHLVHFRRETERGRGLSSYPHPRLMPSFWEFPSVSMGLSPMAAIYQARFNRYLEHRGFLEPGVARVWAFLGDGETDEPESLGALTVAVREGLDNLTFVVNCNLQRLDGPVRGNGKIIQELESVFRGAGWNVLKIVWGRDWDDILARDTQGKLREALNQVVDGEWQKYASVSGSQTRERFFAQHPEILQLVAHLTDDQILGLKRGGHDVRKIHAAFHEAMETHGRPTVVLAHTVKGYRLGGSFEAKNVAHQQKNMKGDELKGFRDRLDLPIPDEKLKDYPFYHPGAQSPEVRYLEARREALGGPLPSRKTQVAMPFELPPADVYAEFTKGADSEAGVSTTMAFARLLSKLLKAKGAGPRIVPIVPDEARTFGMDPLFRQIGIYAPRGQLYEPIDSNQLLYYREASDGQLLQEGISEAGAISSFTAAGTCAATHGHTMIPFYVYYSMFGFQRTGDQIWAFADIRGRGFLMGATAGRTTLNGEGLQHQDGHSHIMAATVPNIMAYDPAFAFELAMIIKNGLHRMYGEGEDVFYYITLQNENYPMPSMPEGVEEGIIKGLYRFRAAPGKGRHRAQLFGSGSILVQVLRAQEMLAENYGVAADVWSVTSYQQLRKDALFCERANRLHPRDKPRVPYVQSALQGVQGPIIAASDYLSLVPDQIARWMPGTFLPLGTDGFGMSDTRQALRRHFEVDAESIVIATLSALHRDGKVAAKDVEKAIQDLGYDPEKIAPLSV